jgi:hypothetical protein
MLSHPPSQAHSEDSLDVFFYLMPPLGLRSGKDPAT